MEQLDSSGSYGAHAEVLAYVGADDVRYSALVLTTNKAVYTVRILVDLATAATTRTSDNAATVFNLRNPQLVPWSTLFGTTAASNSVACDMAG
ncbi:hypothetical protein BPOR_0666g00080 [Botrytis porri]|uniref:Uncharacterized protein n=1 Tax=Botrytis porri TaxID=87229 RepID=A0A4Z1KAW8_9HELO|nr:hypothetical protein BPOR_0666g00080 [Botrytis porri]